jgi:uncharacterized protein (DUF849 family)
MTIDFLIIEAAINGGTPKSRNPAVPRTPEEIAEDAVRCVDAGAAIVHNHNDEPVIGAGPTHDSEPYLLAWRQILAQRPDTILYPTMGSGGPGTDVRARYSHIEKLAEAGVLGLGLVDPGSVNLGPTDYDGRPSPVDLTYVNTFRDARHMFDVCARFDIGPSISIFEPGFLRVALAYHEAGAIPAGAMIKLYFGGPSSRFGLRPTETGLEAYLEMLEGTGLAWSVAVLGGDVIGCGLAQLALARGGHVRVGLEDFGGSGQPSNVELIEQLVELAGTCGRPIADAAQAREILGLRPAVSSV